MIPGLSPLWRLIRVLRALKRYRAWFAVEAVGERRWYVRLALNLPTLFVLRKRKLPARPGARLAAALVDLGPAYVKLGQLLATRADMVGEDLAADLRMLQDRMPPFSTEVARAAVAETLGRPVDALFADFAETPVAAASIAQVHKARTQDGAWVAVKVLRPGVESAFRRDLEAFAGLADLAERISQEARRLRLRAVVKTLADGVSRELDLRLEAAAASELGDYMAGEAGYRIPKVDWRRTGRRAMTLEWVDGIALSEPAKLAAAGHDRRVLAARVVQIFLKQAMRDGYFHADLHQGNFLVEPDGTLVALDFGIMGRLDREAALYLADILYSFQQRDYRRAARAHFRAGYVPKGKSEEEFAQALRAIAEPIHDRPVSEVSAGQLLGLLFATTANFDMQTRPELVLLQRAMMMVEGLAATIDPEINMWEASRPVIEEWIGERASLEVLAAEAIIDAGRSLARLPEVLSALETVVKRTASEKDAPQVELSGFPGPVMFGVGAAGGLLLGLIIAFLT